MVWLRSSSWETFVYLDRRPLLDIMRELLLPRTRGGRRLSERTRLAPIRSEPVHRPLKTKDPGIGRPGLLIGYRTSRGEGRWPPPCQNYLLAAFAETLMSICANFDNFSSVAFSSSSVS